MQEEHEIAPPDLAAMTELRVHFFMALGANRPDAEKLVRA